MAEKIFYARGGYAPSVRQSTVSLFYGPDPTRPGGIVDYDLDPAIADKAV